MAIIYGRAESERDLLSQSPNYINKVGDIETVHQKLKDQLIQDEKHFFEKLPSKINEEEKALEKIKNDEKITIQNFDEKIKNLEKKKEQGGFSSISSTLKISFLKNFSKRREINKIKELEEKQQLRLSEWKEKPKGIFNKIQNKMISEIKNFDEIKKSPIHAGAKGELDVIDKLSKLNNDYHVLCGLNIGLSNYVTYDGKKNLRSAQMDFVVVSKKGVILIEVKNWSSNYYNQNQNLSPHEQVDRAGRVLWIALKSWSSPQNPRVTSVLLSIQANMRYDPRYKFVYVSDLNKINYFIENRREEFSDEDVKRIVDRLKHDVTE